jgi:thioredoxin-dependent peroxiredoxin
MTEIAAGDMAPDFCLPDINDQETCLKSYRGKWVVLYFYPKDNTSGCTREAAMFTAALETLRSLNAEVLGVSRDSTASHRKFAEKHGLGVKLLSDADHKAMESYGSWAKKKMYGRESFGTVRSTFLIDPQGNIAHVWRSVNVKGHVEAVIKTLKDIHH